MEFTSPVPKKRARIEIIPLIDIMFFLLASFMMVSLSQVHMKGIRVNLPAMIAPTQPLRRQIRRTASVCLWIPMASSTSIKKS